MGQALREYRGSEAESGGGAWVADESRHAVIALSAAALIAAPGAFSATPQEIYRDYADNGRLDNVHARRSRAGAQERGCTAVRPGHGRWWLEARRRRGDRRGHAWHDGRHSSGTTGGSTPGGTAGGQAGGGTSPVQSSGGLPFTGLDLSLIAAGALRADPAGRSAAARRQAEGVRPRASADGARWRPRSIRRGLNPPQTPRRRDRACARRRHGRSRASVSMRQCCCLQRSPSSSEARLQA